MPVLQLRNNLFVMIDKKCLTCRLNATRFYNEHYTIVSIIKSIFLRRVSCKKFAHGTISKEKIMVLKSLRRMFLLLGLTMPMAVAFSQQSITQDGSEPIEEIITTGTRRDARSADNTPAAVDVIGGDELRNQGDLDMSNLLRTSVPSYNVNTQPISDAATLVRPANLRGLAPDSTLVLVNGKRRHRSAVISFLGGGISDGSQGPDISVIPTIAVKQVEVLRDGAASQYGSDAIAGVINFVLRDAADGVSLEAQWGETYEGDGAQFKIAGNVGFPLGQDGGFLNLIEDMINVDIKLDLRKDSLSN